MWISKDKLTPVYDFIDRSLDVNKKVILGIVPQLQKNSLELLDWSPNKNFWYRQKTRFEDFARASVLERFLKLTALLYLTNKRRGEIFMQYVESFFTILRAIGGEQSVGDFWQVEEEITHLSSVRRRAVASGDKQTAREITTAIERKNQIIPQFLKRVVGRRARRKLAGKSAKRKVQINA